MLTSNSDVIKWKIQYIPVIMNILQEKDYQQELKDVKNVIEKYIGQFQGF